ncbi:MAG TPA: ABC transporter substrate-binding protein [Solirubrobacteraceae bacterium]|nr:ABC transporter substrate-binding protein [Solirubrobacteraceae bacterium]
MSWALRASSPRASTLGTPPPRASTLRSPSPPALPARLWRLARPARPGALTLLACLGAIALSGCGGSGSGAHSGASTAPQGGQAGSSRATLILDFVPNAVHAGIYRALAAGYYRRQGIDLRVVQPSATSDTLKLIDAGSAQFGLADGSDVAGLIAGGGDAQAVTALVQRPLGGLIAAASERLRTPADLQGRTVGITGVPSDKAVLDTEVAHAGGDPRKVRVVTIGFDGAQALAAGRIAAFTGFIPDDGVQLLLSGRPITAFALDANGGPAYPGLVAFTTRREIAADPALVRGFVAATVHGYEDTLADPTRSLRELLAANPTLQPKFTRASLDAYLPLFAAGGSVPFGTLQPRNVEAMSSWMLANHLIGAPVAPARYGTNGFLPGA